MRSWILLAGFGVITLIGGCGVQRSDRELLTELRKLTMPPDFKEEKITTENDLWKKRGKAAQALLKEFESSHGTSPLLNDGRAETLKILRRDPEAVEKAVEL